MERITPYSALAAAVVAALVLAACGTDELGVSVPDDTLASTVVDDGLRAPTPITVTGERASASGDLAAPEAASSGPSGLEPDSRFAPFPFTIEYVLGDVGALPTNDTGFLFEAGATVSGDRVAALAAALGVVGEPVAGSVDRRTQWQVGPDDGSAPTLSVSSDAQLTWWYNSGFGGGVSTVEACTVSIDSNGNTRRGACPEPTPPVGVPTPEEAEALVRGILTAAGEDVSGFTFESTGDVWFASVRLVGSFPGFESLDSFELPCVSEFSFGENGVLQWATGAFSEPEAVGPYPLIGIDEAFGRLQDQQGYFGGGPIGGGFTSVDVGVVEIVPPGEVATNGGAVEPQPGNVEPVPVGDVVEPSPGLPSAPVVEPGQEPDPSDKPEPESDRPDDVPVEIDVEPIFEPEIRTVTLVSVEADIWWAFDQDGSVWLLPAYRFIGDDGGRYTVPAVTDEFLIVVEPTFIDEPPPLPPDTPIAIPAPPPQEPIAAPQPVEDPSFLKEMVGLSLDEFTERAATSGYSTRLVSQDGVGVAVTDDLSETRVNVAVEGTTVVAVESIG
jgi:hypothetical protein